ncbi:hypothetical protein C7974DRAFT_402248 [Boeremia exigua]|uniref:uncharacterized protein n=1 Tax=Boeremia exigua TaxID=749465 RepID=UPI001E8D3A2D|nr:uncharacterized protein C7974DRAFT_402248 [Boeremia exigua]KAH6616684.1 hypothetical protein C7974DRAFT_402248 [Boeremia exigua]
MLGEQQIGSRYSQDIKEMGDIMVVGDTLARDLLLHIAVNMQAEIIKGLQMAVQNPTVVLNLRLLHEATITNRKDTFVTLDELKQRLVLRRPLPRQLQDVSKHQSTIMTVPSTRSNTFELNNAVPQDNMTPELKQPRSSLARYLQTKRSNSTSTKSSTGTPTERPTIDYCRAFEEMVKARGEDRATLMNDIDEITMLYKGLDGGAKVSRQPWNQNEHPPNFGQRRSTLDVLMGEPPSQQKHHTQGWDSSYASDPQIQPHLWANLGDQDHSMFNQNVFNSLPQHATFASPNPYPLYQTQSSHRFSDSSSSSTPFSDVSRDRHDSDSSRTSHGSSDPRFSLHCSPISKPGFTTSIPPNASAQRYNDQYHAHMPYATTEQTRTRSIAPLTLPERSLFRTFPHAEGLADAPIASHEATNEYHSQYSDPQRVERVPNPIAPFGSPPDSPVPTIDDRTDVNPTRPSMLSPDVGGTSSSHSSSSGHTVRSGVLSGPWLRNVSAPVIGRIRQPSVASTDSSGSGSFGVIPRPVSVIPSSTVQSPKPGQERMMNGRPCKDNSYWGFCKGAWDVREELKKGLALRNMPSGMYNSKEVWECKSCNFRGNTYSIIHPSKKGKKETIVDPNLHTSKCGIRYRWIFLAKSHVKKKTPESANEDCNYGCVICSVELKVTSIFGNVDTLMYHLLEHASDMTQITMKQTKCIVGRTAGVDEDWDINMPLFADVCEVEG